MPSLFTLQVVSFLPGFKDYMNAFRNFAAATAAFAFLCFAPLSKAQSPTSQKPMVVVISIDAFGYESLRDPYVPAPTLKQLMQNGVYTSMQPINPTVTWPNHTAMVTGVNASKHHVMVNGLIVDQRDDKKIRVDAQAPKSRLVAVPTVYDVAHSAGLTTGEVDWVAILKAPTIDWSFAENPDPQSSVVKEMLADGTLSAFDFENYHKGAQVRRDLIWTNAAIDIIKKHHPNLLLLHYLALDGIQHQTGYGNDAGKHTIAYLDDQVKSVIEAVKEAGDLDRTTFLIVSDHGQQSIHRQLHAEVLLKEAKIDASVMPEGGSAMIYLKKATPELLAKTKALFVGKPGVQSVLTAEEAAKEGYPLPSQTDQAPDVVVFAADDYAFNGGESKTFESPSPREVGGHGYPNTNPLMQEIFIASGNGIRKDGKIPPFKNIDIAPTIAKLLGIQMENIDGKALDIFTK